MVVVEEWRGLVSVGGMFGFHQKLMAVRRRLRTWSKETFGNNFARAKEAEDVYRHREIEYDLNRDEVSKLHLQEVRAVFMREVSLECAYWRQKANIKWLNEGDANTKYFHALVKQRRNNNFIAWVQDES